MTTEELKEIEERASASDIPRLAAEVRKLQTLVHLAESVEDAKMEEDIADEMRMKKFDARRQAEKAFRETLAEHMGRPVVKTEHEREREESKATFRRLRGLAGDADDQEGGKK